MSSLKESEHLSLPFQVVKSATKNFTTIIGKGGFGEVYKGELKLSNELTTVAVKRLLINNLSGQGAKEFLTEIHLLSRYNHPNLVSLLGYCEERNEKVLIYKYAHRGSLDKYLRSANNSTCELTWKQRLKICIDAARGLDYLHNHVEDHQRVIHRDVKSANVLLDDNWKAMIADLGLSKLGRANESDTFLVTNACGTEGYCDPAYRQTRILTKESDVYSFGVVLFEVLCGRLCFQSNLHSKEQLLPQLAQKYYKKEKLKMIIDPTLIKYVESNSVKKFARIAYQCLLEDRKGRPSMDLVLQELEKALDMLENTNEKSDSPIAITSRDKLDIHPSKDVVFNKGSMLLSSGAEDKNREIKSKKTFFRRNWTPIPLPESWDQHNTWLNQSELRDCSSTVLDEIFTEHVNMIVDILCNKKSDNDVRPPGLLDDLLVKCFSVIKKLLENHGGGFDDTYIRHCVAVLDLYKEVSGFIKDAPERLVYESVACVTIIISRVAQGLKASLATKDAEVATNGPQEILDHAKASGVIDSLLSCLVTCGTSLISGSSKLLLVACETCEPIWSLIDAFEIQHTKENALVFPLSLKYSIASDRISIKGGPLMGEGREKIVELVTQAFLGSEPMQVAIFYCLRQRLKASWSSVIQIISRCCIHNNSVATVVCGLSSTLHVNIAISGSGDNTIVSEVFSIISLCASFDRDPQTGDTISLKSKVSNPNALIHHACLLLASVAQSLNSTGVKTALSMLTSSPKRQKSRLSDLAHHYSLCDVVHNIQPHSMSAMLAFASILYLEIDAPNQRSIHKKAFPLIPKSTTLCDYLKILSTNAQGDNKIMFSYWHGFRDGFVGLLCYRLYWVGVSDLEDSGTSDHIPKTLIDLLGNKQSNEIGLSTVGVLRTIYLLFLCLKGGSSFFHQVLLTREHVKILCDLISDVLLCEGPGGGDKYKIVKYTIELLVDILEFPFVASEESNLLQDMESGNRKDMLKDIETNMDKYVQILSEVGVPGKIVKCLQLLEVHDTARPLSLVTKMVVHRSLVVELVDDLLDPIIMKKLLDDISPYYVKVDVLEILTKLAEMDKEFYEHINGADIFEQLRTCLTHVKPSVRAWACDAIKQMCLHSSYFYGLLAHHDIISVLANLLFDKDNYPLGFAVRAILYTAFHSDFLYEELRKCIPQLAQLLLSAEFYTTKQNVASCLHNLSFHSDKLGQDMISKGAIDALLKVVSDYSVVALDPSKIDDITETPLDRTLSTLAKMCDYPPCKKFISSSNVYPTIGELRQSPIEDVANHATKIIDKTSEN
ncbi:serine/threonine-protein kinase TIO-like [Rutidosis leptorrhynchoides]|uniref:serine/threonine-protein kinase TIO-like n=1 Tax=Rutidosis leptorrhynchoides TaxID=125765 RepID=UPI003A9A1468